MSQLFSNLKSGGRAAVIALTLAAASVAGMATPATAQQPTFRFDFGISGGDSNFSFGTGRGGVRIKRDCLTNNEIRSGLRRSGFSDVRFLDRRGNRVNLIAEWRRDGRDYTMRVDRCTGRVTDIERARRGGGRPGGPGLHFQFGN